MPELQLLKLLENAIRKAVDDLDVLPLTLSTNFADESVSSIDMAAIALQLEKDLGVEFSDAELLFENWVSVETIFTTLRNKLPEGNLSSIGDG
ncbi:acyl carrier protein [Ensifer sp. IC4062]|nr:acyl carrier protein [Ensifer sp. IC4062]MCA1441952.1 acyl carrier protein [Ensifer sp. IC4062]